MFAAFQDLPESWGAAQTHRERDRDDDCLGLAAQLAFYFFLGLFPAVLFLLALASFFPLTNLVDEMVQALRPVAPSTVVGTLLWVTVSLAFKFYVANFGTYDETYGAVGAVIVLLLWFYLSGLAILVGAEMNAEIEHASPSPVLTRSTRRSRRPRRMRGSHTR
jgi:uncharacterized BrkB/YihY/UPF0761 family membrane protein